MHLYYTGEENSNPKITFPYTTTVDGTIAAFGDTVKHIMKKVLIIALLIVKHARTAILDFIVKNRIIYD